MRRAWVCLVLVALCACSADGDRPGVVVLPGMVYSVPYDSHDRNSVTGQTLLLPPEGTAPYGFRRFAYGPGPEEAIRASRELIKPPLADGETMETHLSEGQQGYEIFCKVCHGPAGDGDGPIIGRFPNPPSLRGEHALGLADGQIYHVIFHGQGLMPPYNKQIREAERWRILAYVRSLQQASAEAPAASAPPAVASVEAGGPESAPLTAPTEAVEAAVEAVESVEGVWAAEAEGKPETESEKVEDPSTAEGGAS